LRVGVACHWALVHYLDNNHLRLEGVSMTSPAYKSLQNQISLLQRKAQKILAAESKNKNERIARVLRLMKKLGIGIADLQERQTTASRFKKAASAKSTHKSRRKPVPAKYRDTATGNSWSGRGKTPRWLAAREAEGHNREEFRIS
jgi:DNA-binding protein H-NS